MKINSHFWAGILFTIGIGFLGNALWFHFEGQSGLGIIVTMVFTMIALAIIDLSRF